MNLRALKHLYPNIALQGVEINQDAAKELKNFIGQACVFEGSIFNYQVTKKFNLSLTKGVLIHINPEMLPTIYDKLYEASESYILVCEYYNPPPASIQFRGHSDKLFKRVFAGEMLDSFKDLTLVEYGFSNHRDPVFPKDDINWFLMKKS